MVSLRTFLGATAVAHAAFAAGVYLHARATGRSTLWAPATLVFGVAGVVSYVLTR